MFSNEKKFTISKAGGASARKRRHGEMRAREEWKVGGSGKRVKWRRATSDQGLKRIFSFAFIVGRPFLENYQTHCC